MTRAVWVDGMAEGAVGPLDRGLAYGDGLFETIALRNGRAPLLDLHLARLREGAARLRLALDTQRVQDDLARAFAVATQRTGGDGVVKLIVTRGDGARGYRIPDGSMPRHVVLLDDLPAFPAANATEGVELYPCAMRLGCNPQLAGLKHLNRLEQVLARSEWDDARFAEGLVCDIDGRVVEGTFSNVLLVQRGELVAPSLARCGVAGVMRRWLLAQAPSLGIRVREADVLDKDLARVDEMMVCNSLFGLWPVLACGARRWPAGPVTRRLQDAVAELFAGGEGA
jgi:4-amino-4-deoxychorismate lyase